MESSHFDRQRGGDPEKPEHKAHFPGPARKNPGAPDLGPVDPEIDGLSQWANGLVGVVHVDTPHRPLRPWRIVVAGLFVAGAIWFGLYTSGQ